MTSLSTRFILGASLTSSILVLCISTPTPGPNMVADDCQRECVDHERALADCIQFQFTPDKVNETVKLFNQTKCVTCNHFCRKKDSVMTCIGETAQAIKVLSDKARRMVPFLERIVDEGLSSFCENIAEMIPVYGDDQNSRCLRESRDSCHSHLLPLDNIEEIAFCNSSKPEFSSNNEGFICQHLKSYLECTEKASSSCTEEVRTVAARFTSTLRNTECNKYF